MTNTSPFSTIRIHDVKKMDHDDIENIEELTKWTCCCFKKKSDSRLIKFFAQYCLIVAFFSFCSAMLFMAESCEDSQLYSSLLLLVVGVIIPQPK